MKSEAKSPMSPTVYTDMPSQVRLISGGLIEMVRDCSLFISWKSTSEHTSEHPQSAGTHAIRWVANGQRSFTRSSIRTVVDDSSYMMFNPDCQFASSIQSETPVTCFTICLQPDLIEDVLRGLITPADRLVDDPHRSVRLLRFIEKTYPHDQLVSPLLRRFEALVDGPEPTYGWVDEQFRRILVRMLDAHRDVLREMEMVPAARASTRIELYQRLERARDHMEASLDQKLTVPMIAQEAWLSPHHFLRLFKQTYHETPHQYLMRRRMERAQTMLRQSDMSITEICYSLGFESLGSFSWLFRRRVGLSPIAFRKRSRLPSVGYTGHGAAVAPASAKR